MNHELRFMHVVDGKQGNRVDKQIMKVDEFLVALHENKCYQAEYVLKSADGDVVKKGCYVIVDGGYVPRPSLMTAPSPPKNVAEKRFARMLEGVRKDVERAFGVLKGSNLPVWRAVPCNATPSTVPPRHAIRRKVEVPEGTVSAEHASGHYAHVCKERLRIPCPCMHA